MEKITLNPILKRLIDVGKNKRFAAMAMDVSPQIFSNTVNGRRRIYLDEAINICAALHMRLDDLVKDEYKWTTY